jgi:hypothetical protein
VPALRPVQFLPPPLFLNTRLVVTPCDTLRLKPLASKSLRRTVTMAIRVNKRHRASCRVRPLLPKALLMPKMPFAISVPSLLREATSLIPCEHP